MYWKTNTCAQTHFLVQQSADHTCDSAIYFNMSPEIIKKCCVFETFTDFKPPPETLETETEVLLANVETPWHFNCDHDKYICALRSSWWQVCNAVKRTSLSL